jgi:membrane fusion protein (multidrug efflux system)
MTHPREMSYFFYVACIGAVLCAPVHAQTGGPAPAVGVIEVANRSIFEKNEFLGRIEAVNRVSVVARVTAFLDKRLFKEGGETQAGAQLYQLEKGPFEADLAAKQAMVAQLQATLENAKLTTGRAKTLLGGPAGQQSIYDAAIAAEKSLEAQVQGALAQVQVSQINLDYTNIRSPIDGKVGKTTVTMGNVVGPQSGMLTSIVSQDPMYVTFPVPVRMALELRERYAARGGFQAVVIKVQLPDGRTYGQSGQLNFVDNTVAQGTDTITLRGSIANPSIPGFSGVAGQARELTDGEFVTVSLLGVEPTQVMAIPRAAVLVDQLGSYVYVLGVDNKAEQRRITLGQSTKTVASVTSGLSLGEKVIAEGLQRVKPGQVVQPGPASAPLISSLSETPPSSTEATAAPKTGTKP